jgi:hypothetical protein
MSRVNYGNGNDGLPVTPPSSTTTRVQLSKLSIPGNTAATALGDRLESRPSSSSISSLFLAASPSSAGQFLSPPQTPISSAKSPPSRNDIFSEDWTTPTPTPIVPRTGKVKEKLKGLGLPGQFEQEYDIWDVEARKRRSGAYTWSSRTSRSSTPSITDDGVRVDFTNYLGRGLTSVVYGAMLATSEVVAAKIPCNAESQQILEREAAVLTHIHSTPHSTDYIIPFYGKYFFDDTFALCLELCPQTMQEYITSQSGSSPPVIGLELWKSWLSTLLSAVEFLHKAGMLHNDIKPHNILLTSSLHPYLSDFAVSTPIHPLELPSPPELNILGTTVYTAPELLSAEDVPTTPASDIYSLGITMFVAATGLEPFSWTKSITQKIMLKKRGDIFAGTDVRMPQPLIGIIKGMCFSDPARRWDYNDIRTAIAKL